MAHHSEKETITTFAIELLPNAKIPFIDWQAELNGQIALAAGFISLEFLAPTKAQAHWLVMERFSTAEENRAWHNSSHWLQLIAKLETLVVPDGIRKIPLDDAGTHRGVTEVIVAEVLPDKESGYRAWSAKIHQIEAQFPGFRGTYVQSPTESKGKLWITLLQFDTMEHLDHWLHSAERMALMQAATSLISSMETHRVISPYGGWFTSIAKDNKLPPAWKQTMIVLLVLFPVVMLEFKFLSPWTTTLDLSLSTFIGNAISVSLLSFPLMPLFILLFGWWLSPQGTNRHRTTVFGTLIVAAAYLGEILLFRYVL